MKPVLTLSISLTMVVFPLTLLGRGAVDSETAALRAEVARTIYFSALDAKGVPVTDLTVAELAVKEGGRDRVIASVKPATEPMQIALLVDDAGTGAFQAAVAQFLQVMLGRGQFAISVLSPQPMKVANFTEDVDVLKAAIGRLNQRGRIQTDDEQIIEAVAGAARELQQRKAARPAIVVLTVSGEGALADHADTALDALKSSGASLNVLYITGLELGKVLGDGPKQSGGMIQRAAGNVPLGPVASKIAENLLNQYALTYTIPDGVRLSDRFSLTTTRKGITLLAPSRIPDK